MRVAFYSPLPPERTGIGDYSFELLEFLRELIDVTAVVADNNFTTARAPEGIEIARASDIDGTAYDCCIYQMGNNSKFHRFVFEHALEVPGLLVMHDPSLADFHAEICAGAGSVVFQDEVTYDSPGTDPFDLPRVDIGRGMRDLDRLQVLIARRIVGASVRTLLNSGAMAEVFRDQYPGADIQSIRLPANVVHAREGGNRPAPSDPVRIGVFGGINYYKRVRSALDAFARLRVEFPTAHMVIAGRADDRIYEAELRRIALRPEYQGALEFATDLTLDELEQEMARCDLAIQLRWPTAGEMSATLMRTFGAGRPAAVTDVPQFGDLDPAFCWKVPHDFDLEVDALLDVMRRAAADPVAAWDAGQKAREFVAAEATYEQVARDYVTHITECAELQRQRPMTSQRLNIEMRPGFNVVSARNGRAETIEAADALAAVIRDAGIDAVRVELDVPYRPTEPPSQRPRPVEKPEWPPPTRLAANAVTAAWFSVRGPYEIDVLVVDDELVRGFGDYAFYERRCGHSVVAYLAPEAVPLTDAVRQLLLEVDEVWTPSGFGADALQVNFPSEIAVVPLFPWPELIVSDDHDSAAGPCRFLTVVDVSGGLTRSNAWGCIESFRRAFSKIDRGLIAHLTIALHGQPGDEMSSVLQATVDRISGSVIGLSSTVDRLRVIEACDVYVAIGRSDPYGIAVSEAMSFRRPVIATSGYGTPDFATPPAVLLVGAKPEPVSRGAFHLESVNARRFGDGQLWATPDLNSAALSMRHLATDPNARSRIGMNGERRLREARSELRSAKVLRDRVEALQPAALGPLLERVTSTGLR